MKKIKQLIYKYFWLALFCGWSVFILVLSVIPANEILQKSNEEGNFRWDYLEHFVAFFLLAVIFGFWRKSTRAKNNKAIFTFIFLGLIYACITEIVQVGIPGRSFNPVDLLFNIAGILTGITGIKFLLLN